MKERAHPKRSEPKPPETAGPGGFVCVCVSFLLYNATLMDCWRDLSDASAPKAPPCGTGHESIARRGRGVEPLLDAMG